LIPYQGKTLILVNQHQHSHFGIVAWPLSDLYHPCITTWTIGVSWGNFFKQFLNNVNFFKVSVVVFGYSHFWQARSGDASSMDLFGGITFAVLQAALGQRNYFFGRRSDRTRFGLSCNYLLVTNQVSDKILEQGSAVGGTAV
jgi:hypothetical protein